MEAIDTNVLVRYLTADDETQFDTARRFIEQGQPKLVNVIVLAELSWVLHSVYRLDRGQIGQTLEQVFSCGYFICSPHRAVKSSIDAYKAGFDLADSLIAATNRDMGAPCTYTFDRKAALHKEFELLT